MDALTTHAHISEILRAMTSITARAELSIVIIVGAMTIKTISGFRVYFANSCCMAAVAVYFLMCTIKFKLGFFIMVKSPDRPAIRIMACMAVPA